MYGTIRVMFLNSFDLFFFSYAYSNLFWLTFPTTFFLCFSFLLVIAMKNKYLVGLVGQTSSLHADPL